MSSISARISDDDEEALEAVAELLGQDKSTVIRTALREGLHDIRVREAVARYQTGEISVKQAARLADVTLSEWLDIAHEHNLTTQLTPEDIDSDVETALEL